MKARRKPIKLLLSAGLCVALAGAYLHFGLLPGDLKRYAIQQIETLTGHRVYFEKAVFIPFHGWSFYGVRVADASGRPLFAAKSLSINARLLPFLTEKKIIIPRVWLDSPVFDVALNNPPPPEAPPPPLTKISGQIEVPVLPGAPKADLSALEEGPNAFVPENVYLTEIEILDGTVRLRREPGQAVFEELRSLDLRIRFDRPPVLDFGGSVKAGSPAYAHLAIDGKWDLDAGHYDFLVRSKIGRIPDWLVDYQKKNFLVLSRGVLSMTTRLKSKDARAVWFHTEADLKDSEIRLKEAVYAGQMALDATGAFDFASDRFTAYKGNLDFVDVDAENVSKKIRSLRQMSGRILFQPDLLEMPAMHGRYQDIEFDASGVIRSFKEPAVEADVRTHSDIAKVLALLSEEEKRSLKGFEIGGRCQAVTHLAGPMKDPSAIAARYRLVVTDGRVKNAARQIDATGVAAELLVNTDGIEVSDARFMLQGKPYRLGAFIPRGTAKQGRFRLVAPEMTLNADYTLDGETALVKNARVEAPGLSASFQGKMTGFAEPVLDVKGTAEADLERAAASFAPKAPALKNAGLAGTIRGPFVLKGPAKEPLSWDLQMDGSSPVVLVRNDLRLDNFEIQIRLKDGVLNLPYLHATPYGGTAGASVTLDLRRPDTSFNAKIFGGQIDLTRAARDLKLKDKEFAGTMIFDVTLQGLLTRPETWTGAGIIDVRKGHLWKTDLFKKMGELPFVKVLGMDEVVFRELNGAYQIRDKHVWTQNLHLFGDTVDLAFEGSIGFDQTLDLDMSIGYSNSILEGAVDTGGIVPFVLEQAGAMISRYHVGGTLSNPKTGVQLLPQAKSVGKKLVGAVQELVP